MSPQDKQLARALAGAPSLVVSTVGVMEELARILLAEITVVTQRRMNDHPALLKRKQRLAVDYRTNMKMLSTQGPMLKALPDEAKDAIRVASKRLAEAVEANARALRAAIDATRRLIQNVMSMVKAEALPKTTYKNPRVERGSYSPMCIPIAISRTV